MSASGLTGVAGYALSAWQRMKRAGLLLLFGAFSTSCATQAKQVGNATATLVWFRAQYEQECLTSPTPTNCKQRYQALEKLRLDAVAASSAIQDGTLPKAAMDQLDQDVIAASVR